MNTKPVFQGADDAFLTHSALTTLDGPVIEEDISGVPGISTISIDCEPLIIACRVHIDVRHGYVLRI